MIHRKATVWTATTHDGYPLVFVWNNSLTVNVYTGLNDGSNLFLTDIVETDIFTLYGENGTLPTADDVEAAITEYLNGPTTCRNCDKPIDGGDYCGRICEGMDRFPAPRDDMEPRNG